MNEKVVIAFATDHKFRYYTGVALFSLMEHASPDTQYEILILSVSLSEADSRIFYQLIEGKKNFCLRIIDVKEKIEKLDLSRYQLDGYYSIANFYRLFLHEFLPEYEKVLYLDSDIIVQDDIRKLFAVYLKGFSIGAARDLPAQKFSASFHGLERFLYLKDTLKLKNISNYFNSGVLLMDLKMLRECNFSQQVYREIAGNIKFEFLDQDILNRIFYNNVLFLNETWNFLLTSGNSPKKKSILHFAGIHPWLSRLKPFAELWWSTADKLFFIEDMENELACHPDRVEYLQTVEKLYRNTLRSTCWRFTAVFRFLPNTVRSIKRYVKIYTSARKSKSQN